MSGPKIDDDVKPDADADAGTSKAGTAAADTAADAGKGAGKGVTTVAGIRGLYATQWQHSKWLGGKAAAKVPAAFGGELTKGAAKYAGRAIPLVGNVVSAGFAVQNFRDGDVVGGILGVIGAIPVVGYVGIGAGILWEMWGPGGGTRYEKWAEPDGNHTHMLPAAAAAEPNVADFDRALTAAQEKVFGFQTGPTGTVWDANPPAALRVDTLEVATALTDWLTGIATICRDIDTTLATSGEPYMLQARERLQGTLAPMAKLPEVGKQIAAQLTAASDAAGDLYAVVLAANAGARASLADGRGIAGADLNSALAGKWDAAQRNLESANAKLETLFTDAQLPAPVSAGRLAPPQRNAAADPAQPQLPTIRPAGPPAAPLTPAPAPAPAAEKGKSGNADDIAQFLDALRAATPAVPQMPSVPMPQLPMMPGLGGGVPLDGGQPLQQPASKPLAAETPRKLASERPNLAAPAENKMATPAAAKTPEKKDTAAPAPVAGAAAAAPGKPQLETPLTKAATPKPSTEDRTVEIGGKKITFPDAKTAALARELAAGTAAAPASLADAATKAGLVPPVPGQDPGQQVAPADAKPGHLLVAGDTSYLLLGDGNFLDFTSGKIVDADQMPKDLGSRGGYFRLLDAAAAAPAGPVSPPVPETTTRAVESAGSPGVPAAVTAGGPANAAATDTGRGTGTLNPQAKPLNPAAIR